MKILAISLNKKKEEERKISYSLKKINCMLADIVIYYLRTFTPIVSTHPYCARKFTCHVIHRERALNTKLNNNRADGLCYNFAWI